MKRKKPTTDVIEVQDGIDTAVERVYAITEAKMADGFCHYSFEVLRGTGEGDIHKVKGTGIAKDDLRHAFGKLNVHLAAVDEIFKHSGVEIQDIDKHHGDELATKYYVTGFKIKGGEDNESVILVGSKHVFVGGRIDLTTPKIALDKLSPYPWWNELKAAIDVARREVELYKEGKYEAVEEEQTSSVQMTIGQEEDDDFNFDNHKA